jgi:hypothetical protein
VKTISIDAAGAQTIRDTPKDQRNFEQPTPQLSARQFGYLKASMRVAEKRLTVVWDEVEAALDAADHPAFAGIYADRFARIFDYAATLEKIAAVSDVVEVIAGAKIDPSELLAMWIEAATK